MLKFYKYISDSMGKLVILFVSFLVISLTVTIKKMVCDYDTLPLIILSGLILFYHVAFYISYKKSLKNK